MKEHLTGSVLNVRAVNGQRQTSRIPTPSGMVITNLDIHSALVTIPNNTATGLDQIPGSVLKDLKDTGQEYLARLFNKILDGTEDMPDDWKDGRLSMIEKTNSTRRNLRTFRPITVTPVLHRLFTKILCRRIRHWMEHNKVLGEMQAGFRQGRRGEDNLLQDGLLS